MGNDELQLTSAQLVFAATEAGYAFTERQRTDWSQLGLLARGNDKGRGQGRGKEYSWPAPQRELLLLLLDYQQRAKNSRSELASLPIALWLLFGDAYVPLAQAKRAMATWAKRDGRANHRQAQAAAQAHLDGHAHPDAAETDREALRQLLENAAFRGAMDHREVEPVLARVLDPHHTGMSRGPGGLMTASTTVRIYTARLKALAELSSINDGLYERARQIYTHAGPLQPRIAIRAGNTVLPPGSIPPAYTRTIQQAAQSAGIDLLTTLGMLLIDGRPR